MYASIARFWRGVHAGAVMQRMLVLVAACAITLGTVSAASAKTSLYSLTTTQRRIRNGNGHGQGRTRTPFVWTFGGPLEGIVAGNINEFLGIPYAAPPVGNLRWTPPQPYGWHGFLDASSFGSECTQPDGSGSENCLFLNVYVPNFKNSWRRPRGGLPVMFWIHGGGLTDGAGSDYDPTPLVNQGVIVVTINYRLGYLGFFAQSAIDAEGHENGNYGLMDQQFALRWVRNNIAFFGGDPFNVTMFGESAGGHSVYCNLASPTAAGLYAKAISESGSYLIFDNFIQAIVPLAQAETTDGLVPSGATIADSVGCSSQTAACLRAVPNTDIVNNEAGVLYAFVDGTLLTQTPQQAFAAGAFNKVPIIAGTNHDEWRIFVADEYDLASPPNPILTEAEYDNAVIGMWGGLLGPIVESVYPYSSYPSGGVALGANGTDGVFACSARNADQTLSQFTTTYAYEFNDENAPPQQSQIPGLTFPLGAFHSAELQYLFDVGYFFELDASQLQLSAAMVSYWTQFAKTGNPNSPATPAWAPYSTTADEFQSLIPPTPVVESTFNSDHLCDTFWNLIP
jgi:para-nitrobenzyl esterase